MAQSKKKTATKTKKTAVRNQSQKKAATRTTKCKVNGQEKMHVYIVTVMSMVAAILLCANAAMMMV